jgi:ADP-sugar diphosphatase
LQPDDVPSGSEDEKYVILAVQPRIPAGSLALSELPAGMLDDSGTFAGGAAKEIEEETGMKVAESDLLDMTSLAFEDFKALTGESLQKAVYASPGGSDEYIPLFLHQKRIKRDQLKEWQGKLTGLRDEGEKITLRLVKLKDLWRERDAKALAAFALYQGLREAGEIQ